MDTQRRRPKAVYGKKGVASAYRGNAAQIFGGFSESSSSKPTHIRFPDTDCDVTPSEPPQPPPTRKQPRATATRDPLGDVSNRLAALNLGETVAPAVSSPKSQKRDKQSPVRTLQKPEKTEKLAQPTPKPKPTPRTTRPRSTPQTALATRTTRKTRSGHSQTDFLNSLPTWIEPLKIAGMKGVLNWGSLDSCTVTKIGEGSYAEVYRLSDSSTSTSSPEAIESIFKIIPLKPEKGPGSRREGCVAIKDVISELVIMMEMGVHNGFLEFKDCSILCGRPTANFRQAWKTYALGRTASEDDEDDEGLGFRDPKSWPIDQLFLSLELGDAGVTLERFPLADEDQAWDLVLETIVALAKGEEVAEFEVCLLLSALCEPTQVYARPAPRSALLEHMHPTTPPTMQPHQERHQAHLSLNSSQIRPIRARSRVYRLYPLPRQNQERRDILHGPRVRPRSPHLGRESSGQKPNGKASTRDLPPHAELRALWPTCRSTSP